MVWKRKEKEERTNKEEEKRAWAGRDELGEEKIYEEDGFLFV